MAAELLTDEEIARRLEGSEWRREGDEIVRDLKFEDFAGAMRFANAVAEVAEEANHHPDILIHGWNKVRLSLTNHSAGGLTDADFTVAGLVAGVFGTRAWMAELGRKGGSVTSEAKAAAVRENGKKGGRPRKVG